MKRREVKREVKRGEVKWSEERREVKRWEEKRRVENSRDKKKGEEIKEIWYDGRRYLDTIAGKLNKRKKQLQIEETV